ncbi:MULTISPECIES: YadA-like family protein [Haemophilus]|nr:MULTISPECIES: YadA-like family protein [Haemophilus]EGF16970.1 hypothetical protein HMPREF9095_0968 [Haemophilus aegyptius ATCC 11116]OBX84200.1 hypothetical protein A9520_09125 [Haemophilus aegyptius]TMQ45851.1 hypothetical protein AO054_00285 [Haemophilus influenzae biotype aegyptius]UAK82277.1 YadA-like family protein [Haemophilus aegyptius]VEH54507.1 trimeric autotransporter adhesin [Haemophilus aegyptius]
MTTNNPAASIAVGADANVTVSPYSIALGKNAKVLNSEYSLAAGTNAKVEKSGKIVALGLDVNVTDSQNSVAIGWKATSNKSSNAFIGGYNATSVNSDNTVVVGVGANITESHRAIATGSNVTISSSKNAIATGSNATINSSENAISTGSNSTISSSKNAIATGVNTTVNSSEKAIVTGFKSKADKSEKAIVQGVEANATNSNISIVTGFAAKAVNSENTIVLGSKTESEKSNKAVVLGNRASVTSSDSAFVGGDHASATTSVGALVLGNGAKAENAAGSVVLGEGAKSSISNGVALGSASSAKVDRLKEGYGLTDLTNNEIQTQVKKFKDGEAQLVADLQTAKQNYETKEKAYENEKLLGFGIQNIPGFGNLNLGGLLDELGVSAPVSSTAKVQRDEAKRSYEAKQAELKAKRKEVSTWLSTAAAVSLGDEEEGITRQLNNLAAGTKDTDAVNVAQLKSLKTAGLKFAMNDYDKTKDSTQNKLIKTEIGNILHIQGKSGLVYNDDNKAKYSSDNLVTFNDAGVLRIGMLKSPSFTGVTLGEGDKTVSLTADNGVLKAGGKTIFTEDNFKTFFTKLYTFEGGLKAEEKDGKTVVSLDKEAIKQMPELKGEKGERGERGLQGERGERGLQGEQGERGLQGEKGKSAYESWKELPANHGKSETEFAEMLSGGASKVELQQLRTEHDSLKAQIRKDQQSIQQLDRNMQKMNKDFRAGIAGATAIAFLQGGNFAGESAVSVAVGTYKGEHALAVGYGRRLTNNKIEVKLGASVNSRSDVNAGGSVGFHW